MTIRAIGITKVYNDTHQKLIAVDNISLDINEGDFISIVGPSGSGKTTLISIIGGIIKPTKGEIYYNKEKLSSISDKQISHIRLKKMGFIFQHTKLLPNLTVIDNILIPFALMHEGISKYKNRATEYLKRFKILDKANVYPDTLSGGERQKIAIIRALIHNPTILIADEPTGELDYTSSKDIFKLFTTLNKKGMTILVVTHNPELAGYAKDVYIMKKGKFEKVIRKKK